MFCFLFITVAKALHLDSYSWLQYPGSFWFSSHILRQPQYASSDPTTQGLWHPLLKYMHSSSAESLHQVPEEPVPTLQKSALQDPSSSFPLFWLTLFPLSEPALASLHYFHIVKLIDIIQTLLYLSVLTKLTTR